MKATCLLHGAARVFLVLVMMSAGAWAQGSGAGEPGVGEPGAGGSDASAEPAANEPEKPQNGLGQGAELQSRPWADGVSEADQARAKEIFEEANELLSDSLFIKAVEKYREALKYWQHPAIYYNLALGLLNLDQPLEVYAALESAMKYGPAPLDLDKFERARSYKKLVEKQLATVEIVCDIPGAKVSMDGKDLFVGPGRRKELVRIGKHNFIATKAGYIPTNQTRDLEPGENVVIELKLFTDADLTTSVRRWDAWKPWALVSVGVVFGAAGGTMHYLSQKNFEEFDERVKNECDDDGVSGCQPGEISTEQRDNARLQQNMAIGSYAVGGVVLATGAVLVYMNRSKLIRKDVTETDKGISVAPILTPDTAGVAAYLRF